MSKFRLQRCTGHTTYRYDYSCLVEDVGSTTQHSTTCDSDGGGDARYLDLQDVECPAGSVMSRFRLQRCSGDITYRYDYSCAVVNVYGTTQHSTTCDLDGGGDANYLDRQNVECPAPGSVMSQFHLQRCSGGTTMRYDYSCAALWGPPAGDCYIDLPPVTGTTVLYSDGCTSSSTTSADDRIEDVTVTVLSCAVTVDVKYRPSSSGSWTANDGVSIKVIYRYATDSSWTTVANTNILPSGFTINAVNTYTTSFSATKDGDLYVRAMIVDRSSSTYSIGSLTCIPNGHYDNADVLINDLECGSC